MKVDQTNYVPVDSLRHMLAGCRLATSSLAPDFSLAELLTENTTCRVVKENDRRQIYHLELPPRGYFIKISTLIRPKDQWRHLLLPYRKWSEWRNLHRLLRAGIAAAKPVLKGENKDSNPQFFFLLTEQVQGKPLTIHTAVDTRNMGEYAAWLHSKGVFHTDLHPSNVMVTDEAQKRLIDVQQVFFLPLIPRWLRAHNLGKIYFNLALMQDGFRWAEEFITGYNRKSTVSVSLAEVMQAAGRHQNKKYNSRSKRCCRNSTEFVVVKDSDSRGYRRRSFQWGIRDLRQALENGQSLKESHVISYQGVCLKRHRRRPFHENRCLTSWKMSRALEVRGIQAPRALGYFEIDNINCFVSELLNDTHDLNAYLSSLSDEQAKRRALKKLAVWMRKFYATHVWQRDFKSENILCRDGEYFMVDLDGVRIRRLSEDNIIANLAQLNASVSNAITIKDRLRFYYYYSAGRQVSRHQRRAVYRKVWDITRTKSTVFYDLDPDQLVKQIMGH
jgi:tRNA A-37 threonylcarbamoyl transferase component Bud32